MKTARPLAALGLLAAAALACGGIGRPAAFPTAGITVQAFPHVEISTATGTPAPALPPSDTPADTDTPAPTDTPTVAPTATALIQVILPTATRVVVRTRPPATPTAPPTNTAAPPAGPIQFRAVQWVSSKADPTRNNGAYVTLSVEFAGSRPPFSIKHDSLAGPINPNGDGTFENAGVNYTFIYFTILSTCGGPPPGTITVTGGDGQTFTTAYSVAGGPCS